MIAASMTISSRIHFVLNVLYIKKKIAWCVCIDRNGRNEAWLASIFRINIFVCIKTKKGKKNPESFAFYKNKIAFLFAHGRRLSSKF